MFSTTKSRRYYWGLIFLVECAIVILHSVYLLKSNDISETPLYIVMLGYFLLNVHSSIVTFISFILADPVENNVLHANVKNYSCSIVFTTPLLIVSMIIRFAPSFAYKALYVENHKGLWNLLLFNIIVHCITLIIQLIKCISYCRLKYFSNNNALLRYHIDDRSDTDHGVALDVTPDNVAPDNVTLDVAPDNVNPNVSTVTTSVIPNVNTVTTSVNPIVSTVTTSVTPNVSIIYTTELINKFHEARSRVLSTLKKQKQQRQNMPSRYRYLSDYLQYHRNDTAAINEYNGLYEQFLAPIDKELEDARNAQDAALMQVVTYIPYDDPSIDLVLIQNARRLKAVNDCKYELRLANEEFVLAKKHFTNLATNAVNISDLATQHSIDNAHASALIALQRQQKATQSYDYAKANSRNLFRNDPEDPDRYAVVRMWYCMRTDEEYRAIHDAEINKFNEERRRVLASVN